MVRASCEPYKSSFVRLGILGQLDTRLVKLDKTIAPFGIQPLSKEAQSESSSLKL